MGHGEIQHLMKRIMEDFKSFPKIARLAREIVITEKIDGTNGQIHIEKIHDELIIRAGSRSQYITPENDNHGFAKWVEENKEELLKLGEGRHYGEWWGSGIQRGYGLKNGEKRFSLFNVKKWHTVRPKCCDIVPVIYQGAFNMVIIDTYVEALKQHGSMASPGFMKPEGIIVYHTAANMMFKKTIEKDEEYKGNGDQ